ncbi:MAG: hypothetical protein ABI972_22225 [Acidobacteriota bacterium]
MSIDQEKDETLHLVPPADEPPEPSQPRRRATRQPQWNAHPIIPKFITVPCELDEDYTAFLGDFVEHFNPQSYLEMLMVGDLAQMHFRLNRFPRIEAGLMWHEYDEYGCHSEDVDQQGTWGLAAAYPRIARSHSILVLNEVRIRREAERLAERLIEVQERRRIAALPPAEQPIKKPRKRA